MEGDDELRGPDLEGSKDELMDFRATLRASV